MGEKILFVSCLSQLLRHFGADPTESLLNHFHYLGLSGLLGGHPLQKLSVCLLNMHVQEASKAEVSREVFVYDVSLQCFSYQHQQHYAGSYMYAFSVAVNVAPPLLQYLLQVGRTTRLQTTDWPSCLLRSQRSLLGQVLPVVSWGTCY